MSTLLSDLGNTDAVEPTGWFRWLYFHYAFRNPVPNNRLFRTFKSVGLPEFAAGFLDFWDANSDQALSVFTRHAWALGTIGKTDLAEKCWPALSRESRGTFLAGLSEIAKSPEIQEWITNHVTGASFSPESACQLACNSIRYSNDTVFAIVLNSEANWSAPVLRGFGNDGNDLEWDAILRQLSNHLIDLILEAAILCNKPEYMRAALKRGANPDISIWRLERSYNEQYCALSYVIQNGQYDLAKILLEAGANPKGTAFGTDDSPLYFALSTGADNMAEQLVMRGAAIKPNTPRPSTDSAKPRPFKYFGVSSEEITWAKTTLLSVIPLTDIGEKVDFHEGNAQGGYYRTFLQILMHGDRVDRLIKYEAMGLDTRLTAEEFCTAVQANANNCLTHLLSKNGPETLTQVMEHIRARKPDFGKPKIIDPSSLT
jgi:hypothetical protein